MSSRNGGWNGPDVTPESFNPGSGWTEDNKSASSWGEPPLAPNSSSWGKPKTPTNAQSGWNDDTMDSPWGTHRNSVR